MKAYAITPKGQVTIPVSLREELNLKPGDKVLYKRILDGILIKPAKKSMLNDYAFLKDKKKRGNDLDSIRKSARRKIAKKREPQ